MTRVFARTMLGVSVICALSIIASVLIGRGQPPAATPVIFAYTDSMTALSVIRIDLRTGVRYRRDYNGLTLAPIALSDCYPGVLRSDDNQKHLGFLDLHTGQIHGDILINALVPASQYSPDEHYIWLELAEFDATQFRRVIINTRTGTFVSRPVVIGSYLRAQWSPDSRQVLEYISNPPQGAMDYRRTQVDLPAFLVNRDTGDALTLPDAVPRDNSWTPDSSRLALVKKSGEIVIVETATGQPQARLSTFNDVWMLAWQDNQHLRILARRVDNLLDTTTPYTIQTWSPDDNTLTEYPVTIAPDAPVRLAPDLTRAYFFGPTVPQTLVDTATGQTLMRINAPLNPVAMHGVTWPGDGHSLLLNLEGGTLRLLDTRTGRSQDITLNTAIWPLNSDGLDYVYFSRNPTRLGLLHLTDTGLVQNEIEQPGAFIGGWCAPEMDA